MAAIDAKNVVGVDCPRVEDQPVAKRTRRLSSNNCRIMPDQDTNQTIGKHPMINGAIKIETNRPKDSSQAFSFEYLIEIYEKNPVDRTEEDVRILEEHAYLLPEVKARIKMRQGKEILRQRVMEFEESIDVIKAKANKLADLIKGSKHVIIYTGAGISTSASIPDYRGPNGLWTQIRQTGSFSITKVFDLSRSEPTYTHMAIKELARRRIVKHVVSQNCDGLHLRSGIPQTQLSEIHGDMYIEVCPTCEKQYFRQADVTERTSRFRHKTGRKCHSCSEPNNNNLIDTIVLYGERSRTKWPMNWDRASKMAKRADLIICMGSSLKTLRRYGCLWPKSIGSSSSKREPETKLVIINLQYTSKDKNAVLKINGKCDLVMQLIMQRLNIEVPAYDWTIDPLMELASPFTPEERANLKRNLIFEIRQASESPSIMSNSSITQTRRSRTEASGSPSLFVSELTDDPDKKRLKMRIRAVNIDETMGASMATNDDDLESGNRMLPEDCHYQSGADVKLEDSELGACNNSLDDEEEHNENEKTRAKDSNATQIGKRIELEHPTLPGWLGKSLGATKTSSYRRKRHGNKGRKHALRHQGAEVAPVDPTPANSQELVVVVGASSANVSAPTTRLVASEVL